MYFQQELNGSTVYLSVNAGIRYLAATWELGLPPAVRCSGH